jgi:cyanophycinase
MRPVVAVMLLVGSVSAEDGPLVIVGGGKIPDAVRARFFELAGGPRAKIVVIPTASASADDPKESAGFLESWEKLKPASVTILHTRDRKAADDPAFSRVLADATAVWLSGGDQSRLTATYRGTHVEQALAELRRRGGVIGGTSAGAAVQSEIMITGGKTEATTAAGFGWLPGAVVDQHFLKRDRVARLLGVLEKNPSFVGIGIDEGTAVVARDKKLEVLGESYVVVIRLNASSRPLEIKVLKGGDTLSLADTPKAPAQK